MTFSHRPDDMRLICLTFRWRLPDTRNVSRCNWRNPTNGHASCGLDGRGEPFSANDEWATLKGSSPTIVIATRFDRSSAPSSSLNDPHGEPGRLLQQLPRDTSEKHPL